MVYKIVIGVGIAIIVFGILPVTIVAALIRNY